MTSNFLTRATLKYKRIRRDMIHIGKKDILNDLGFLLLKSSQHTEVSCNAQVINTLDYSVTTYTQDLSSILNNGITVFPNYTSLPVRATETLSIFHQSNTFI